MSLDGPQEPRTTLLLCDWAAAIEGKLYAQGAGWTEIQADTETHFSIAVLVHVPYARTNEKIDLGLRLLTEDGEPFPSEKPLVTNAAMEVGRPPGIEKGEETSVPFAVRANRIKFPVGGYRFEASIDGEISAIVSFRAKRSAKETRGTQPG